MTSPTTTVAPTAPTSDEPTAAALREFAKEAGLAVGSRGPISREVREAYAARR